MRTGKEMRDEIMGEVKALVEKKDAKIAALTSELAEAKRRSVNQFTLTHRCCVKNCDGGVHIVFQAEEFCLPHGRFAVGAQFDAFMRAELSTLRGELEAERRRNGVAAALESLEQFKRQFHDGAAAMIEENKRLRSEVEASRAVVEAACDWSVLGDHAALKKVVGDYLAEGKKALVGLMPRIAALSKAQEKGEGKAV